MDVLLSMGATLAAVPAVTVLSLRFGAHRVEQLTPVVATLQPQHRPPVAAVRGF